MAIIGAFADEIIAELGYMSADKKLDRRNIIVRADAEIGALLSAAIYMGTMVGGEWRLKIDEQMSEPADVLFISRTTPILYDSDRDIYYSVAPTEFRSFHSFSGIRRIKPVKANTSGLLMDAPTDFINQRSGAATAYGLLESAQLGGAVGYEIEGQKWYYNNLPLNVYDKVLVTYLPMLTGLKETDTLPMSAEFASMLMDKVKNSFLIQKATPPDNVTDGEPE